MIDPSFDTQTMPPRELVDNQMTNLQNALSEALGKIDEMTVAAANYRDAIRGFEYRIESVKSYIIEQISQNDFDEDAANEIASILGFELEKEVYFTVTVQISGTARIAPDEDAEGSITNMEFSMNDTYYNKLDFDVEDVNVTDVDISEV